MKLSKLTIFFGAYIVIAALYMNQAWYFLERLIGRQNVKMLGVSFLFMAAALLFWYTIKSGRGILKILFRLAIISGALIFALRQPYLVEKLHVAEYGLLGWLAARDLNKNKLMLKNILMAFLFAVLITVLDEGLQKLLPWRVCDLRDVITNCISSALGIIFFALSLWVV